MITRNQFSPWDYVVFAAVLFISAAIGIFYGCYKSRRKNNTEEFLLASREMTVLPVSLSLLASFMSAITLLGAPAEIYVYGTQYFMISVGFFIMAPIAAHLFLPVFYRLKITSVFEYLELRFKSKGLRVFCAVLYIINMSMYLAIALYAPTLALNAVTGLNVWISVFSVGIVCTFYTSLGGMKAVMWTDVFQILIMFTGMFAVLIKGSIDFGGFGNIWRIANEGGRIEFFNLDPNPLTRHSLWTMSIGGAFLWTAIYGVNQAQVQRGMCTPTLRQGQIALWINAPGLSALVCVAGLCGLVVYAQYKDCDPLSTKVISARDQLLPLYVMDALAIPGLPGLFVASLFSAALSSISSALNSLSAITLKDFAIFICFPKMTEERATLISKLLSVFYGIVMIALTFVAANLGGVLQAAIAIFGMLGGPILGLFSLAIIYPCANYKGAYAGFISSLVFALWLGIGANVYKPGAPKLPVSTAGCYIGNHTTSQMNLTYTTLFDNTTMPYIDTTTVPVKTQKDGYLRFYELSYVYYSLFATIICHVVGLLVSFLTGGEDRENLDPKLVCPIFDVFCCYLPKFLRRKCWCDVQHNKQHEKTEAITNGKVAVNDPSVNYIYDNPNMAYDMDGKMYYGDNDKMDKTDSKQFCTHL